MADVDIAYFVEHVARELDVACAVKFYAESKHRQRIIVLSANACSPIDLTDLRPRVVVVPYCYRATGPTVTQHLPDWPKPIYFNLAWEQLIHKVNLDAKAPSDAFAQQHVLHHAWSTGYRDFLQAHGVPEEHVYLNGQPVYTLYDEPYCRYLPRRVELARLFGLDPDKRWILFPENYGWAFLTRARARKALRNGVGASTIRRLGNFCRQSLPIAMRWCAALAAQGSVEVVVRPRPSTSLVAFRAEVARSLGNWPEHLHLIKQGSVREWVLASDVVVSSYSTTLIEASVAGKPAYIVEPIPMPDELAMDWHAKIAHLMTESDFASACRATAELPHAGELGRWARRELMANGDAIANLAAVLAEIARPDFARPPVPPKAVVERSGLLPDRSSRLRRLYWTIRTSATKLLDRGETTEAADEGLDSFDQGEVARRVDRWKDVLRSPSPFVR